MLKNLIYAVLLGIGMAACLSQQDEQNETATGEPEEAILPESDLEAAIPDSSLFLIREKRVGNLRIGMPIEEMRNQVSTGFRLTDTTLHQEGTPSTAYVVRSENQKKGLLVEQSCEGEACRVWRISVLGPKYKTAKGIHVGTSYGELQQAYKIRSVTFEEGNVVALPSEAGMSFLLDHSSLSPQDLSGLNAATVPKKLPIERILVY